MREREIVLRERRAQRYIDKCRRREAARTERQVVVSAAIFVLAMAVRLGAFL